MPFKNRVGLVLAPTYFMYVDKISTINGPMLTFENMQGSLDRGTTSCPDDPYQCKYIIGDGFNPGIIREYYRRGWQVDVIEQSNFMDCVDNDFAYDVIDFQFATEVPLSLIENLLTSKHFIAGWWPGLLTNKCFQAIFIRENVSTKTCISRQVAMWSAGAVSSVTFESIDRFMESEHLIVKSFYTALSKMPDGRDYLVLKKSMWNHFIKIAIYRPVWFIGGQGIIVSELIQTHEEPFEGANNIVHKVHLATGLKGELMRGWSLECHKLLNSLKIDSIGDTIKEFGELYESRGWIRGSLESYRSTIEQLSLALPPFPSLYGADFMCQPNGRLVLLEFNKLAGTYLDPLGSGGKTPLEAYVEAVTSMDLDTEAQLESYRKFLKRFGETLRQIEPVTWI